MATAADEYYEVLQRSMITGVPTSEYNKARDAFLTSQGMDTGDTFAATNALSGMGYMTGMPTREAVLEYGAGREQGSVGNSAFYAGGTGYDTAMAGEEAYNAYLEELDVANRPNMSSLSTPKLGATGATGAGGGLSAPAMSSKPFSLQNIKGITSGSASQTSFEEAGRGDVSKDYAGSRYKISKKGKKDLPVVSNKGLKVGDLYAGLNIGKGQGKANA